jgi:hypothetical protein
MIRQQYAHTKSLLMDSLTFHKYEEFAVENKNTRKILPNLNVDEALLYSFLITNSKRLEQERIPQDYILKFLPDYSF